MGTRYVIKYIASRRSPSSGELHRAIESRLNQIVGRMSPYLPDSEIAQLNHHPSASPMRISEDLSHVLRLALRVSEETCGAFDVTVGPAVEAYGFGPGEFRASAPRDNEGDLLRARIGYRFLELDPVARTVCKNRDDIRCDLSGIAKGYAVDCIAGLLDESDIHNYMVEIGGEVRAKGSSASNKPWRIAIERPITGAPAVHRVIELADRSAATSGDYRVFYLRDGRRISHTIDPRTCRPVEHNLASVTVIHTDCALADAWATALMVLGPEEGFDLAERKGLAALFLIKKENGVLADKPSSAFPASG